MVSCRKLSYVDTLRLLANSPQYIYVLKRDGVVFYVGRTNNPERRLTEHTVTYGWRIDMEIVEEVEPSVLVYEREIRYILHYRQQGDILNIWPFFDSDDRDYLTCSLEDMKIYDYFFYSRNYPNYEHMRTFEVLGAMRE